MDIDSTETGSNLLPQLYYTFTRSLDCQSEPHQKSGLFDKVALSVSEILRFCAHFMHTFFENLKWHKKYGWFDTSGSLIAISVSKITLSVFFVTGRVGRVVVGIVD